MLALYSNCLDCAFCAFEFHCFFFFFFSSVWTVNLLCRDKNHYSFTVVVLFMYCSSTVHAFKNIKNGSHGTFHTFKNYFATVFSVFNFQFSVSATISSIQTDPKWGSMGYNSDLTNRQNAESYMMLHTPLKLQLDPSLLTINSLSPTPCKLVPLSIES